MEAKPLTSSVPRARGAIDRTARRAVQIGFLALFLYPLLPVAYQRITFRAVPAFASWLLPWDPLLLAGQVARRDWVFLVIGAPLLLVALTLVLGRFFCGWVCPVGAVLDLVRPLAFWQRHKKPTRQTGLFPPHANSRLRYCILIVVLVAGVFSLQALGVLDPLVIFHRTATAVAGNLFALRQPPLRVFFSVVSLVFVAIMALELWQPRFWCRNVCPLGALLSVFSRFSLLNRQVSNACSFCGDCRRACFMNAIPRKEPHDTDYTDCVMCLECEGVCPNRGVSFAFGALAGKQWHRDQQTSKPADRQIADQQIGPSPPMGRPGLPISHSPAAPGGWPRFKGTYVPRRGKLGIHLTRREWLSGAAAGVMGVALAPLTQLDQRVGVLRPPGALPEEEFVRTCILCQECVRVCPTGGLKPTGLEVGLAATGTPQLVPSSGACTRNPNCPGLCAQVCPVGAIKPITPQQVKIGRAVVDHPLCLAWDQQVKCLVCVEACLVEAAQVYNGRIVVDPTRCTGCGRCENACPVAGAAIHVRPFSMLG